MNYSPLTSTLYRMLAAVFFCLCVIGVSVVTLMAAAKENSYVPTVVESQKGSEYFTFLTHMLSDSSINNGNPPIIKSFTTETNVIGLGSSAVLEWEIENSIGSITLTPAGDFLDDMSGAVVTPKKTTLYKLTVRNDFGSDTADLKITVINSVEPPVVTEHPLDD